MARSEQAIAQMPIFNLPLLPPPLPTPPLPVQIVTHTPTIPPNSAPLTVTTTVDEPQSVPVVPPADHTTLPNSLYGNPRVDDATPEDDQL
ncbi:hypothetical protein BDV93DRAFT_566684 [Ceratobasidium sp. AG-I]|nr:hypothetical protein BDV93DRAFT_566684 [Ceratobasidium sp. AG-I]